MGKDETVSECNYLLIFFKIMTFCSLKTDQTSLGPSKIMLANGADNSAVHSFQTLRTFLVNFQNVW